MARADVGADARLRVDSYTAAIQPIGPVCRDLLHEPTVSVFWPHRASDLDVFLSLGKGWLALDEIGRPLSSAMYFPMGAIRQQQGTARPIPLPNPVPGLELVPVAPEHAATIAALDTRAYGAARRTVPAAGYTGGKRAFLGLSGRCGDGRFRYRCRNAHRTGAPCPE